MPLTRADIIEYARRYVAESEITDFPCENDVFALLMRPADPARAEGDDAGWALGGFCLCLGYDLDAESKPEGKWVWMRFAALVSFPPHKQAFKLQPPHIARGRFFTADRSHEAKIVKITAEDMARQERPACAPTDPPPGIPNTQTADGKILRFRPPPTPGSGAA